MTTDKAVILARGLGKRMRKTSGAEIRSDQASIAQTGMKAMIPIRRPFLDYVMSLLADAGWRRICLVIGPEHTAIREYYSSLACRRVRVEFAVQEQPLGTANAVAAAEAFAAGDDFLCINSDNYYPLEALQSLHAVDGMALAAFEKDAMVTGSNIPAERVMKFAVLAIDAAGMLRRILEKPQPRDVAALPLPLRVSMNCWRFSPIIFESCRAIGPSLRGELELTDAVQHAIDHGRLVRAISCRLPVLDLSSQDDISAVARKLLPLEVDL